MGTLANAIRLSEAWAAARYAVIVAALLMARPITDASGASFSEGLLWRISKADVADSFVLGTIHVADSRVAAIPKAVDDALAQSRVLVMECAQRLLDNQQVEAEEFDDDRRLEPLIGHEAFSRLRREQLAQDIPEHVISRLKPWAAMMKIAPPVPRGDVSSLDDQLLHAALARRMKLMSLESVADQMLSFDAIPLDSQVALLVHALTDRDALAAITESRIQAWMRGDLSALAQVPGGIDQRFPGMGYHYGQLAKHIIEDRTSSMHYWLFMPMRAGRVFVAIGASHLGGDKGLLELLKQDGYRVTRIW